MTQLNDYIQNYKERILFSGNLLRGEHDKNEHPDVVIQQGSVGLEKLLLMCKAFGKIRREIPYSKIIFPEPSVAGHVGKLIIAEIFLGKEKKRLVVWILCGRHHYYESGSAHEAAFMLRVCQKAGAKHFILLNAVGGLSEKMKSGNTAYITDCTGNIPSPNIGYDSVGSNRFVDATKLFDHGWYQRTMDARVPSNRYFGVTGPEFESQSTAKDLRNRGFNTVGMSIIPEAYALKAADPKASIAAVSLITNEHFVSGAAVTHDAVIEMSKQSEGKLSEVVWKLLEHVQ